jgi:ferrochelatase
MRYLERPTPKTAILLIQLGTPDSPDSAGLRRYLRQFLSDRRVVDLNRLLWWPILQIILLFRPKSSAAKYREVWNAETGSPLMHYTRLQANKIGERFGGVPVRFAMTYGNPSVDMVTRELIAEGFEQLLVMPMYPQYSATTTAAATDALFRTLSDPNLRAIPAVRIVPPHPTHPAYIRALKTRIEEELAALDWKPDHFVISFHGIPKRYCKLGDLYARDVKQTTAALVQSMGWPRHYWSQTFQSIFGREVWLKPYTNEHLEELAKEGKKKVMVVAPGFTADCLETIDEIGREFWEEYEQAGGEKLHLVPCLNDHPAWIDAMEKILREEGFGWLPMSEQAPHAHSPEPVRV